MGGAPSKSKNEVTVVTSADKYGIKAADANDIDDSITKSEKGNGSSSRNNYYNDDDSNTGDTPPVNTNNIKYNLIVTINNNKCQDVKSQDVIVTKRENMNREAARDDQYQALRSPQCFHKTTISIDHTYSDSERLRSNDRRMSDTQTNKLDACVGSRSMSYFNYRKDKSANSVSDAPRRMSHSVDIRVSQTMVGDDSMSSKSVLHYNNNSSYNPNHIVWDDELENDEACYNDESSYNDDSSYNDGSFSKVGRQGADKVKGSVLQHSYDKDLHEITHKINDVKLTDEKKRFWRDFYKNRIARRAAPRDDTKDKGQHRHSCYDFIEAAQDYTASCKYSQGDTPNNFSAKDSVSKQHPADVKLYDDTNYYNVVKDPTHVTLRNKPADGFRGNRGGFVRESAMFRVNEDGALRKQSEEEEPLSLNKYVQFKENDAPQNGSNIAYFFNKTHENNHKNKENIANVANTECYVNTRSSIGSHGDKILQDNNSMTGTAERSVRSSLLLRRLHIYDKLKAP